MVGSPVFTDQEQFDHTLRKELEGLDLLRTLIRTPDTPLGVSGMVQRWCLQNDVRYELDPTTFWDNEKHCYRHSLLRYSDAAKGIAFIGLDKYSTELVAKIQDASGFKCIDVSAQAQTRPTEIVLAEPFQLHQFQALGYHPLYIGFQEFTFQIARSIIPFLPDARSREWLLTDRIAVNQFTDWYWQRLQDSQSHHSNYWQYLLKRQKYVICNHREYSDFDYAPIFAHVMQSYLEKNWIDAVILDKRRG